MPTEHGLPERLTGLRRAALRLGMLLVLSACGGGLGGSGDGGDTSLIVPLPDAFDPPYEFRHVPERMLAQFPGSLAPGDGADSPEADSPYGRLTESVHRVLDRKLEVALLQLHLEANWDALLAQCATTADDAACNLADAGIESQYTAAMASWEYRVRAAIELQRRGVESLPDATLDAIAAAVTAKIDSPLAIDNGLFTRKTTGSYRFEIVTTLDLGAGSTIYTARWSADRELTFLSLAAAGGQRVQTLQSSTSRLPAGQGYSNAILMTELGQDFRQERQLNFSQPDGTRELSIESQLTEILGSTKYDVYSRGSAVATGGFLSSETATEDATDARITGFVRETFTANAMLESRAICQDASTALQCDSEGHWTVETTGDPILSQFFMTPAELDALEARLQPFDLRFGGVSPELDTLVLIRRENLTISVTADGIILTIPGLGTLDFTSAATDPGSATDGLDTSDPAPFTEFADSVLCRANKAIVDGEIEYRSFCAGSTEEIENALVVGESFREGRLVIEWQANASIEVVTTP